MSSEFAEAIKRCALEVGENIKPVAIMFGKLETINPLTIKIDQETPLLKERELLFTSLTRKTYVEEDIGTGFILLRFQGGQKFLVLDELKEG